MHARVIAAALASAALAGAAAAARADLVIAQSVVQISGGTGTTGDNLFPFSFPGRASVLDGLYAIDLDLPSNGTAGTELILIQYAPGDPAGELDFVIACGSDTALVTLTQLDFFNSGAPGRRASIVLNDLMVADTIDHVRIDWGSLTLNGGMQIGELAAYDSVIAEFDFLQRGTSRLQIDFVSNPEPGTIALFALGAAGLGALAWCRRRARAAAK